MILHRSKQICFFLFLFFFNLGICSVWAEISSEGQGQERLDKQTAKLSANLLVNDWSKKFSERSFPEESQTVYDEMKKNPA